MGERKTTTIKRITVVPIAGKIKNLSANREKATIISRKGNFAAWSMDGVIISLGNVQI